MSRTLVTLAFCVAVLSPAPASASCSGSAGEAICGGIAESDLWLYLWMDFLAVIFTASDTMLAVGEEPPAMAVHPINLVHHMVGGMTILAGGLGKNGPSFESLAGLTFAVGLTSEAFAIVDTVVIAARHHKQRRVQRRIEQGR